MSDRENADVPNRFYLRNPRFTYRARRARPATATLAIVLPVSGQDGDTEAYRLEVFEAHEGGVSQRKLSVTHKIGSATVERWYQSFAKQRVSKLSGRSCQTVLGIDEHFFTRKKGYATTLVDLRHHKVFDVVLGHSEASLRSYLKRLPGTRERASDRHGSVRDLSTHCTTVLFQCHHCGHVALFQV